MKHDALRACTYVKYMQSLNTCQFMCYSRNNTLLITNINPFRYLDTLGRRKFGDCFVGDHINLMSDKPYFAHVVTVLELEEKK